MISTGYWEVLGLNFSEMRNTVFFSAKMLMERWCLHGLFELSMVSQDLGNMVFHAVPAKKELDKVSNSVFEKINKKLISEFHFNQQKNTNSDLKRLTDIFNKKDCSFIQLETRNSTHPSIKIFWQMSSSLQNFTLPLMIKISSFNYAELCTVENTYCFSAMKLGKIIQLSTALMIPWSVLMVLRYVSLQDFIFSQTLKTTFQNQLWFIPGWWTHFYRES